MGWILLKNTSNSSHDSSYCKSIGSLKSLNETVNQMNMIKACSSCSNWTFSHYVNDAKHKSPTTYNTSWYYVMRLWNSRWVVKIASSILMRILGQSGRFVCCNDLLVSCLFKILPFCFFPTSSISHHEYWHRQFLCFLNYEF